jgi:hypothetical protein
MKKNGGRKSRETVSLSALSFMTTIVSAVYNKAPVVHITVVVVILLTDNTFSVPIMLPAIKESALDMSPFVRKVLIGIYVYCKNSAFDDNCA